MNEVGLLNITGQQVAELCGCGELYQKGINKKIEENFDKLLYDLEFDNCVDLNTQIELLSEEECKELDKIVNEMFY